MDKILHTNIKTVSRLFFEGIIKPNDLVNQSLKKIAEDSKYNSFITVTSTEARSQADKSAQRHANKKPLSELDGVPIAIKDNFCTRDVLTTCAAKMLQNFRPTYNATVCQRLEDAGAVLVGKTNLDQFAMGSATVDSIFGPTKNIWKYDNENFYISGGSSGGSAVSVASGACFASLGSDTGGSTRNPASYCGIVGLKPTYGLISRLGLIPLVNSMDVPGILARTVDDVASVLNVIAGHDDKDSTSLEVSFRKVRLPPAGKMSIKNIRIGIPVEYNCEHLSDEVVETWNEIAQLLENEGAIVKQVEMPHTEYSIVCYSILNQCEVASNMARYDGIEFGFRADEDSSTEKLFATTRKLGFNDLVKNRILAGNYFLLSRNTDKYFNKALKTRRLITNDFDNVWEKVSLLLTPTTLTEAPLYKDYLEKENEYKLIEDYCTQAANLAVKYQLKAYRITALQYFIPGVPAISIPIKLSRNGLPLSVQLMGRNLSEHILLAVAKYIENLVNFPHFQFQSQS